MGEEARPDEVEAPPAEQDEDQTPGAEETTSPDEPPVEEDKGADEEEWTPEQKAAYTKATQKYAEDQKRLEDRNAELEDEMIRLRGVVDGLGRAPAPAEPELSAEERAVKARLEQMAPEFPVVKQLQERLDRMEGAMAGTALRGVLAEVRSDPDEVEFIPEVEAELRREVQRSGVQDPEVIRRMYEVLSRRNVMERFKAMKSHGDTARQARRAQVQGKGQSISSVRSQSRGSAKPILEMTAEEIGALSDEDMRGRYEELAAMGVSNLHSRLNLG